MENRAGSRNFRAIWIRRLGSVIVRPAVVSDIPAILRIEQQTEGAAHWTEEKYRKIFETEVPRRVVLVAEDELGVHGFGVIQLLDQECEVENLAVLPEIRRRGVGKQLLGSLINLARNHGAATIFLEVREQNQAARSLYNKLGFTEGGWRKGYYHNPDEDAILYRL
ncbi:MAG: ribosomal protein S18-alanine N-acetyltransferase [Terriglobales bacterium]